MLLNTLFTIPGTFVDITVMKEAGIFTCGSLKDDRASTVELLVKGQNISPVRLERYAAFYRNVFITYQLCM